MSTDGPTLRLYSPDTVDSRALELATLELLRPAGDRGGGRDLEPYSRAWFEEIELKRYARAGAWLPRILEFTRHRDESLLMIGPGLGSDALQYQRNGTHVTIAVSPHDPIEPLQRNLTSRGNAPKTVTIDSAERLPFETGTFDLAYLNLLTGIRCELVQTIAEFFRILKSGGKLFLLAPSRYDVDFWQRVLVPYRPLFHDARSPFGGTRFASSTIKSLLSQFESCLIQKRHLRRSELPHLWRAFPLSIMERAAGRILAVRATKPIRLNKAMSVTNAA